MNHIILFLYTASFLSGISSLIVSSFIAFRTRSKDLLNLLLLFFAYSMDMFHILLSQYFDTNLPEISTSFRFGFYVSNMIFHYFLLFSLTFLGLHLLVKKKGLILIAVAVLSVSSLVYDILFPPFKPRFTLWLFSIPDLIFFSIILGILILGALNFKRIKGHLLWLIKRIIIICLCFFPFLVNDDLQIIQLPFRASPLMYMIISILLLVYHFRYYLREYYLSENEINWLIPDARPEPAEFMEQFGFSEREKEIIQHVLKGSSNKVIGEQLFISLSTVKTHVYNIFRKACVSNRFELMHLVKTGDIPQTGKSEF